MPPEHPSNGRGQLLDVRVRSIEFCRNDDFEFGPPLNYVILTSSEVTLAEDLTNGTILFKAVVEWRSGEEGGGTEPILGPFELDLTLEGLYALNAAKPDHDELSAWIEFNSEHLLWPYLRTQIANLTISAGLPPLTIYTIGVPTFARDEFEDLDPAEVADPPHDIASG